MSGWIKLHRKFCEKAFYSKDSEKVHLWVHLLMSANHSGKEELLGGKPIFYNEQIVDNNSSMNDHCYDRFLQAFKILIGYFKLI